MTFQSTHPMRGATVIYRLPWLKAPISIHAPHAGCDRPFWDRRKNARNFNPRTPCGVRPADVMTVDESRLFQSTHPMRGATECGSGQLTRFSFQSTHPMRGATARAAYDGMTLDISIHAPHAGCDGKTMRTVTNQYGFQSTHPMRGATKYIVFDEAGSANFNPRTPCGVRQVQVANLLRRFDISIHAPHAGCDPMRGATCRTDCLEQKDGPHAGCDPMRGATRD